MVESILFLTGRLAKLRLEAVLEGMKASFAWKVLDIGVKVAALMTEEIIMRRLPTPVEADKIMLPGRCRADLNRLTACFGVPFLRGPDELKDIPVYFGRARKASDMTKYDIQIFAEIVDASALSIEAILARAENYVSKGANVIDLGCLPDTPFPQLEEAVQALKAKGYQVSVDSADPEELLRGGRAGADFLLSLNEDTLPIADKVTSTPVLIPKDHGDLASLYRATDALDAHGRAYIADPVLDPINFGFLESLERYAQVRRDRPNAEMLLGTGNLTELTDADTTGITAVLLGIASELHIRNVLVVQVTHTRGAHWRSMIWRGASCTPRAPTTICPKTMPRACLRCIPVARFPRLLRRSPRALRKCATRISASRSPRTASTSITATAITSPRTCSISTLSSTSKRTERMPSILVLNWPRPRSPGGSPNVTRRTSRSIGASRPTPRPKTRLG